MNVRHGNPKPINPPSAARINSSTIDVNTLHNGGVNVAKAKKLRKSKKKKGNVPQMVQQQQAAGAIDQVSSGNTTANKEDATMAEVVSAPT